MRATATTDLPLDTDCDTVAVGLFEGEGIAHDPSTSGTGYVERSAGGGAERLGVERVGRGVLEVARAVGRRSDRRRAGHGAADVVVGGDDELFDVARLGVGLRAEAVEAVGGQRGRLDERGGDVVADAVGALPAQAPRAGLARAPVHRGGGEPRALRPEPVPGAEAHDDEPAAGRVRQREVAERRPRLARLDERAHRAVGVVGDPLALEEPDGDGVAVRVDRQGGRGMSAHSGGRLGKAPPMPTTVILGAARTPIGKLGGALSTVDPTDLGATAISAALERAEVGPEEVQHVIMGQVLQAGQGQIPSRQAQMKAGIPKEVSSETVNKVCASGIRAAALLDLHIRTGEVEIGVGGGMESMSRAPYLLPNARAGFRMGDVKALDAMVQDGLRNPFSGKQMFEEATQVGDELEITRHDLDRWALRSHQRAVEATDSGRLPEEIAPVTVKARKGETVVEVDEGPRRDTTLERLASLPGLVGKEGSHTAGNSPGVNDGASALVLASDEWAERNGKEVLAEIVAQSQIADDFAYLARTPAAAAKRALEKAGLQPDDIDLWEINEAFASVAVHSVRALGIDEDRVNVNGGSIAFGHPLGSSGSRVLGTVIHELRRRGGGLGCAAICSGGGQGDAILLRVHGE